MNQKSTPKGIPYDAITTGSALAAGCTLATIADLPVTMEGDRLSVPAKVNGRDTGFWLDSGAFFSIMSMAKAKELGLSLREMRSGYSIVGIGGAAAVDIATIRSFVIAGQDLPNLKIHGGRDRHRQRYNRTRHFGGGGH